MKKIKNIWLSLLCVGCCAAACAGAVTYSVQASADTPSFQVEKGAAVRLKSEYEHFGLRFSATVGEVVEGATYNMLILPAELVDYYNADTAQNKADIVTYMKALAEKNGGKLSIVEDCMVTVQGKIYGSIVNVLWGNIDRDFVGVAYYEKDGETVVAAMAAENGERSIVDVAEKALKSGDYENNATARSLLIEKVRMGEKKSLGYAQDDVYVHEDFRYAKNGYEGGVGIGLSLKAATGTSVKSGGDYALKVTRSSAYNYVGMDLGTVGAGNYQLTFQMKETTGVDYNNWKLMQWNTGSNSYADEKCSVWDLEALGTDTYVYYFTATEEMCANFALVGLVGKDFPGTGEITLDNITLKEVESIPTVKRNLSKLLNENFDTTSVSPYQMGAMQNMTDFDVIKFVDNGANGKALRVEKTTGTGTVDFVLPLGKVTKGQYKLTLQMDTNYKQVLSLQNVKLKNEYLMDYSATAQGDFNYGDFYGIGSTQDFKAQARPLGDNVWEYSINFKQDMDCAGLRLYNSFTTLPDGGIYLQLDNIKFERACDVIVDFENGAVLDYSQSGAVATGKAYANAPYIRTTAATTSSTNTRSLYNFATGAFTGSTSAGGNRSYTNIARGTYGYALRLRDQTKLAFNMGYVEAGTYEVTWQFGLWGSASNTLFYNGAWAYWGTSETHLGGTTVKSSAGAFSITPSAGNKVTYKVTVSEAMDNYYCVFFPSSAWSTDTVIVIDSFRFTKVN